MSSALHWSGKKVLVTGAGGFIGSHLVDALLGAGAKVTAMLRYTSTSSWGNLEFLPKEKKQALEVVAGNIEDPHFVQRVTRDQEVIFHLAALIAIPYSYVAPTSYVRTNIEGTVNVLEAARFHGTQRVVQTSTSECYGTALYTPIDEKHPLQGQSPYSASKIGADKIAESYHRAFDVPVAILRPFNTYGPRQSARAVIPTIISQALTRGEIRLGDLRPSRDLN
ncbi:MAG TPA: SDR family NAD(P)-dependent oxidoreductase, partial [Polyangiaceae bacterium]